MAKGQLARLLRRSQARHHVPCCQKANGFDDETALGEGEEGGEEGVGVNRSSVLLKAGRTEMY